MLKASEGKSGAAVIGAPRDILVLGSTVGRNVSPFSSMYGSTKFGVHGLVEGARRELGPRGIRVSLIAPGFVKSEFQDVAGYDPKWVDGMFEKFGPVLSPEDIARTVTFIVSQPAAVHVNDVMIRSTRQDYP
jgi:NADP-dependent 3-hydroxy acid dehydrogenase YdfG